VTAPIVAKEVLLATNGYTTNLVPAARRGIFPGGSYIITTEVLPPDLQNTVSPRRRMFYDTKHFLNYFRLTPDGRMLFGGRHNLSTDLDLAQSAHELHARMIQVFPALAGCAISHSWTGKLGLTFDLMPHAGRLESGPADALGRGLFYAYGYGGHGVAIASYLGHAMGQLLAGMTPANPFLGLPHQRYFFTPYERFYLPLVSTWFRFLDRIS
jgi:glycine/D-amino acid oxidase-like deaminating enzyme